MAHRDRWIIDNNILINLPADFEDPVFPREQNVNIELRRVLLPIFRLLEDHHLLVLRNRKRRQLDQLLLVPDHDREILLANLALATLELVKHHIRVRVPLGFQLYQLLEPRRQTDLVDQVRVPAALAGTEQQVLDRVRRNVGRKAEPAVNLRFDLLGPFSLGPLLYRLPQARHLLRDVQHVDTRLQAEALGMGPVAAADAYHLEEGSPRFDDVSDLQSVSVFFDEQVLFALLAAARHQVEAVLVLGFADRDIVLELVELSFSDFVVVVVIADFDYF